nr:unnamed protein product [Callosobruchus analis]
MVGTFCDKPSHRSTQ